MNVSYIWLNEVTAEHKTDGMDELFEFYVMHACIQSDPGEPTDWKVALNGREREWWLKSITAEFNNFLKRDAWKFVPLAEI